MTPETLNNFWHSYDWLVFIFLGLLLGAWVQRLRARILKRFSGRHINYGGRKAEKAAAKLLGKAGYQILSSNNIIQMQLEVDGNPTRFDITPDLFVRRGKQDFVVEIKRTHGSAIAKASIRRQVIEYLLATGLPCLLVNMQTKKIQIVELSDF